MDNYIPTADQRAYIEMNKDKLDENMDLLAESKGWNRFTSLTNELTLGYVDKAQKRLSQLVTGKEKGADDQKEEDDPLLHQLDTRSYIYRHLWLNYRGKRRLRSFLSSEEYSTLPDLLQKRYVEAHTALMNRDRELLYDLVTPNAFQRMWKEVEHGSIIWEFHEAGSPQIVTVRVVDHPPRSGNFFAQITVRLSGRQKLAVFDQFGRLMLGSETVLRPIIEHPVFELCLFDSASTWRMVGKVVPKEKKISTHLEKRTRKRDERPKFSQFTYPKYILKKEKEKYVRQNS